MPAQNKTSNIQLNQWQSNEYPKMVDFNEDNSIIDAAVKALNDVIDDIESGDKTTGNTRKWNGMERGTFGDFKSKNNMQLIAGALGWGKWGENHFIFDACGGVAPNGTPCDPLNPADAWADGRPVIMAIDNTGKTHGVRVDTARTAETLQGHEVNYFATAAQLAEKLNINVFTAANILAKLKTVDGAGSGLDADLLDGHQASYFATADQLATKLNAATFSAVNILEKLKTVDGSGSGLDADLLDGHNSNYFMVAAAFNAANILAKLKTVDGASSGLDADLLGGVNHLHLRGLNHGSTSQDPNDTNMPYILTKHAHCPNQETFWHIRTQFYSAVSTSGNRSQIAIGYHYGSWHGSVFARASYDGTWSPWRRLDTQTASISIPNTGWVNSGDATYPKKRVLGYAGIMPNSSVDVNIATGISIARAQDAGLGITKVTGLNTFEIYAEEVPAGAISATLVIHGG